jgi:hypothetical protein
MPMTPEQTKDWPRSYRKECSYCHKVVTYLRHGRNRQWSTKYRRYINGYSHTTSHKCPEREAVAARMAPLMERLAATVPLRERANDRTEGY